MAQTGNHTIYHHTQLGKLVFFVLAIPILILLSSGVAGGGGPMIWIVLGFLALVLAVFHSLTVQVDQDKLRWWFGWGLIRKSVPIADITEVTAVKNRWFYGWGIRLTPHGWLFNVSGWDAVQICLGDRCYRVGTDEPTRLVAAIEEAREKTR